MLKPSTAAVSSNPFSHVPNRVMQRTSSLLLQQPHSVTSIRTHEYCRGVAQPPKAGDMEILGCRWMSLATAKDSKLKLYLVSVVLLFHPF